MERSELNTIGDQCLKDMRSIGMTAILDNRTA